MEKQKERQQKWAKVVARAWTDEGFKQRLLSEPEAVLKEAGLQVAEGVQINMLENTNRLANLVLPAKPASGDISEEQLAAIAIRFVPICVCMD
ncbi:MAG: NHLP leader peptide family RiPP precursor [Isosphaeraceae bacterium]|jgi:hypothetical protein